MERPFPLARALPVIIVLFGALFVAPMPVAAQFRAADIVLGPLTGPATFEADSDDTLEMAITNRETLPVSGVVRFYHGGINPDEQNFFDEVAFDVPGAGQSTVVFAWDGHIRPNPAPLRGTQTVWAKAFLDAPFTAPASPGDRRSFTTFVRVHDVRVDALAPNATELEVPPGNTAIQRFRIVNLGNRDDSFQLKLENPTSGWSFLLDRLDVTSLAPNAYATVELRLTSPASGSAGALGIVDVAARAVTHPAAIHRVSSASFRVAGYSTLVWNVYPTAMSLAAGAMANVTGNLLNQGNRETDIQFRALADPGFAAPTVSPASVPALPAGATSGAAARLSPAAETPPGIYLIRFFAKDVRVGTEAEGRTFVTVPQRFGISVRFPADDVSIRSVEPSKTAAFAIEVTNTGNGADEYAATATQLPPGWTVLPQAPSPQVPGSTTAPYTIRVVPPSGTLPGDYNITLRASSKGQPDRVQSLAATVRVVRIAWASVAPEVDRRPILPSANATFRILIRNDGNVRDTFQLDVPALSGTPIPNSPGWSAAWQSVGSTLTLDPGVTTSRDLNVRAPPGLTISSKARFFANVTSSFGRVGTAIVEAQSAAPDLRVASLEYPVKIYRDQPALIRATVENIGSRAAAGAFNVSLRIDREGTPVYYRNATLDDLRWEAGINRWTLSVNWTPGLSGPHQLHALVDPENQIAEKTGDNDPVGNNVDSRPATVRTFKPKLLAPSSREVEPGQRVLLDGAAAFSLINEGDAAEAFTVRATVPSDWSATPATQQVSVQPFQTRVLPFTLQVAPAPGVLSATISVRVDGDGPGSVNATLFLKIRDRNPPEIRNASLTPTSVVGRTPVRIQAEIVDATAVAEARATITTPLGTVVSLPLTPSTGKLWRLNYTAAVPGTYRVLLQASDASAPPNQASTVANPLSFRVEIDERPGVRFVHPQEGDTVRGLGNTSFTVIDENGVRRVTAMLYSPEVLEIPNGTLAARLAALLGNHTLPLSVDAIAPPGSANRSSLLAAADFETLAVQSSLERLLGPDAWTHSHRVTSGGLTIRFGSRPLSSDTLPIGNPYSTSLIGLPEASYILLVAAENGLGGTARSSVLFRVDNTPPKILAADAVSAGNQSSRILARIAPTPDLRDVRLVLWRNGTLPSEVALAATPDGTFEGTASWANVTAWRVVARDQVGNADVLELPLPTDARLRSADAVPATPAWILVLAAAILALRRRA